MTTPADQTAAAVVAIARAMDDAGLAPNKSGNVSCRTASGFLITPSGLPYRELTPADIAELDANGEIKAASRRPSSEWRMHTAIYRERPEVQAIVHTHSPKATALACAQRGIPAFHYMIALAGGGIRCAPYATFGSDELAANAIVALEGRRAALLANHGVIAVGSSLRKAFAAAVEVENMAGQYLALLAAGLEPKVLDDAEMARVIDKFADYGR
ncbi:MAG: class II aldolase/adducin family protein [Gammaproteobacteria bacterium]|nr:class II aldolase/adducin family protein [Gammaproteobacteria bacterium]